MATGRHFDNNKQPPDGIVSINPELYKARVMQCIDHILKNLPGNDTNASQGGLYVGVGGVAYGLYYLCKCRHFPEQDNRFINAAKKYIDNALNYYKKSTDSQVSLLLGTGGIYVVAALVYHYLRDNKRSDQFVKLYAELKVQCKDIAFLPHGSDEIFVGRAGYLYGAYLLKRDLNVEVLSPADIDMLCKTIINSGKKIKSQLKVKIDSPLMYKYHGSLYLGAGHGLAGILQMLLSFPSFYMNNTSDLETIKKSVDFLLSCEVGGNIPPCLGEHVAPDNELVHWCHGSPGIIYTIARAYMIFKEEKYLDACKRYGELVWKKGLLKKGPGICHGVAGSGYVFLLLYRLTGDLKYLYRAERFAGFMFTEVFSQHARTPDCPFSLYEGLAGTACFLNDILQPDKAEFPLSDIFIE